MRGGLAGFVDARRELRGPCVIGIVCATSGSTYQKPGALVLLDANGLRYGVISGGCLEPDVEHGARDVLDTGRAAIVDFDMRTDEDVDFGSGTGCQGRVRLCLVPQRDSAPLTQALFALAAADGALSLHIVCDGADVGAGRASMGDAKWHWNRHGDAAAESRADSTALRIEPPPRVLLLGAGAESVPLQQFMRRLGWRSLCVEHRGRWLAFARQAGIDEIIEQPAQSAAEWWRARRIDAAVVMSHNYAMDAANLALLAASDIAYIGLLGPVSRRDRLLEEIGDATASRLRERLHAPVGLPLGGSGPDVLALSIASELQQFFAARSNRGHAFC